MKLKYKVESSKMNKKRLVITLSIAGAVIAVVLLLVSSIGDTDDPDGAYRTVELLEKKSGSEESSYQVGAVLPQTDFSSVLVLTIGVNKIVNNIPVF